MVPVNSPSNIGANSLDNAFHPVGLIFLPVPWFHKPHNSSLGSSLASLRKKTNSSTPSISVYDSKRKTLYKLF